MNNTKYYDKHIKNIKNINSIERGDIAMNIGISFLGNEKKMQGPIKGTLHINGQSFMVGKAADKTKDNKTTTNLQEDPAKQKQKMLQEAIEQIKKNMWGEDSEERYQEILKKVENGEELSAQELSYIKMKDPKLYAELKMEIMIAEQFEEHLKHCKNKEQAQNAYMLVTNSAAKMCGIKGGSTTPNHERFERLMKRIDKVWEKYNKGELGKKTNQQKIMLKGNEKEMEQNKLREKQISQIKSFQIVEEEGLEYSTQA